ncbi:hypothetical protein HDC92_003780 [Pedobacter sp. AK017]|uniref:hypothetical protein n=1 Tax=Pedobacter sp. AK017 TaxID=2723073 RepID=UPI0016223CC6|nr:hypothetical protein [Pedobacter sp. AK017]MBB5440082.1 hypothetical protein [Pedobacter sp. AK017]
MKNLKLLLALAVVLGAGSAFTTQRSSQDIYVRTSEGVYEPLGTEGPGECGASGPGCHFEKIGDDFQALDSQVWQPN